MSGPGYGPAVSLTVERVVPILRIFDVVCLTLLDPFGNCLRFDS